MENLQYYFLISNKFIKNSRYDRRKNDKKNKNKDGT